eukprot:m.283824 g.283824  ORF g.283824 m.283824 type:complete len:405 (+) comp19889_c0_seq1:318-1532(+)
MLLILTCLALGVTYSGVAAQSTDTDSVQVYAVGQDLRLRPGVGGDIQFEISGSVTSPGACMGSTLCNVPTRMDNAERSIRAANVSTSSISSLISSQISSLRYNVTLPSAHSTLLSSQQSSIDAQSTVASGLNVTINSLSTMQTRISSLQTALNTTLQNHSALLANQSRLIATLSSSVSTLTAQQNQVCSGVLTVPNSTITYPIERIPGSVAYVNCLATHGIIGTPVVHCLRNGSWEVTGVSCVEIFCRTQSLGNVLTPGVPDGASNIQFIDRSTCATQAGTVFNVTLLLARVPNPGNRKKFLLFRRPPDTRTGIYTIANEQQISLPSATAGTNETVEMSPPWPVQVGDCIGWRHVSNGIVHYVGGGNDVAWLYGNQPTGTFDTFAWSGGPRTYSYYVGFVPDTC